MSDLILTVDGERLRQLRLSAPYTQGELALLAGVRRETIVNLEAGRPARPGSVRKIADALGINPAEITRVA